MARYRMLALSIKGKTQRPIKDCKSTLDYDSLGEVKMNIQNIFTADTRVDSLKLYDKGQYLYEYVKDTEQLDGGETEINIYKIVKVASWSR